MQLCAKLVCASLLPLAVDAQGRGALLDGLAVDDDLLHALERRQLEHRVQERVLEDRAQDHRRGEGVVIAQPDHRAEDPVFLGDGAKLGQQLGLAHAEARGGVADAQPGLLAQEVVPALLQVVRGRGRNGRGRHIGNGRVSVEGCG